MARLAKYGEYQFSDYEQTKVEYAAPLSDNSYRQQPLKDNVFYTFSKAPYSRKNFRIYEYARGYINLDGGERTQIANTIVFDKDCARFIPVINPVSRNKPSNFPERWSIDQIGFNWLPDVFQDPRFDNFQVGAGSNGDSNWGYEYEGKGARYQYMAPVIKWQMNAYAVLPMVCGVYVSSSDYMNGCNFYHKNPKLLDDYFADTSIIPDTDGNGIKIGHALIFKIVSNKGYNTQQSGDGRFGVCDCGVEFDKKEGMQVLVGGYGQDSFPHYSSELYGNYLTEPFCQPFVSSWCLLGLVPNIANYPTGSTFTPETLDIALARGRTINTNNSWGTRTNIYHMCVVGDLQYLDFIGITSTFVQTRIGLDANNQNILAPVPVIKSEYMNRNFLLKVAGQLGLPMITKSAKATEYVNANDLEQWIADNEGEIYMPDVDLDTGEVRDKDPEPLSDIPADDDKRKLFDSKNPLNDVKEMDTSDIDPNKYTEETPLNEPTVTPLGKFHKYYALSEYDINNLVDFLYTGDDTAINKILDGLKLNGENPMNFLIGLRMFPFDVSEYSETSTGTITFGNGVDTEIVAEKINKFNAIIDLGTCTFRNYYRNFLDYEPYTTAKLYIPYCNEIEVHTSIFVGHTINVRLIVDITTGSCTGVVFKDGIACLYANGTIGCEIPITGENATEYVKTGIDVANKTVSAITQIASSGAMMGQTNFIDTAGSSQTSSMGTPNKTSTSSSSSSSTSHKWNTGGIIGGVAQGLTTAYEFNHMPTPLQTNGTSTPYTNLYKPQKCYFIIEQSIPMEISGYSDIIGHACMEYRTLNEQDNYIVAHNPQVQPPNATKQETDELNMLLATGVWI